MVRRDPAKWSLENSVCVCVSSFSSHFSFFFSGLDRGLGHSPAHLERGANGTSESNHCYEVSTEMLVNLSGVDRGLGRTEVWNCGPRPDRGLGHT